MPKIVFRELRALLQHRIGHLGEELLVARELVVLPQVRRQPVCRHGVVVPRHVLAHKGRGEAEGIAADAGHPSAGVEILARRHRAGFAHRENELRERFGTLGQARRECRPVVHLQVDVVVIVHAPRAVDVVVPHPLEIRGEVAGSRGGDEQIAAELEIERLEIVIRCAVAVGRQSAIRRQVAQRVGRVAELQTHAVVERGVVLVVTRKEGGEVASRRRFHPLRRGAFGIHTHIGFRVVETRIEIHAVVRVGREQEGHLVCPLHGETAVGVCHRTAFCHRAKAHHIAHAVVVQLCAIDQTVFAFRHDRPFSAGIRRIGKGEVLLSATVGREAYHQHIVGVGDKRATGVARAVGRSEVHRGEGRIDRERALIVANLRLVDARGDVEFAHRSERAEAKILLALRFVGRFAVEVFACESRRLFALALGEGTANGFEHRGALFVHTPVVGRSVLHPGAAAPQAFLVERESFGRHRSYEVRPQVAVAQRERTAFPFRVGVHGGIARADGFVPAVKAFGVSAPPTFGAFERSGLVETNDVACRGLCSRRAGAQEQRKRESRAE